MVQSFPLHQNGLVIPAFGIYNKNNNFVKQVIAACSAMAFPFKGKVGMIVQRA
jgi:hypothetical protein